MGEKPSSFSLPNPCGEKGNEATGLPHGPTCDLGGATPAQTRGPTASAQAGTLTCGRKPGRWRGPRSIWDGSAGSVEPEGSGVEAWRLRVPASPRGKFLGPERCNCVQLFLVCQAAGRRGAASQESPGQGRRVEAGRMPAGAHLPAPIILTREVATRTLARGKDGSWDRPVGGGPGRGYRRGR